MRRKVIVIGLDGATWELIKPWAEEGKLPTFRKLMEEGSFGTLESTYPPWTTPAWESMSTGKYPTTLNVGYFTIRTEDGSYERASISGHKCIWDYLSDSGFEVLVANVPFLADAYPLRGRMIAGAFSNKNIVYPPGLLTELHRISGGYKVDLVHPYFGLVKEITENNVFEASSSLLQKHAKAFKYLLSSAWDFAFLVFTTPDRIQHKLWNEREKLLKHYTELDRILGELLPEGVNVFVVSDHGFGPVNINFRVNEWLIKEGYLFLNESQASPPTPLRKILEPFYRRLPNFVKRRIAEKVIKEFTKVDVDWKRTKAFSYACVGDIFINLKGRYKDGSVTESEYEKLLDEIKRKIGHFLKKMKIRPSVVTKFEVYPNADPYDRIPDIIILPSDDISTFTSSIGYGSPVSTISSNAGDHRLHGIFIASGPDLKRRKVNPKIYDIAPTILHLYGLPVPRDMDGKVLTEIIKSRSRPRFCDPSFYDRIKVEKGIEEAMEVLKG